MKIHILQYVGALLLLACMVFAIAKLDSADKWVPIWLPFVIVGVGLSLFGAIVARRKHVLHTDIR